MSLKGITWYQGESNVGQASFYACAFPSMIARWREAEPEHKLAEPVGARPHPNPNLNPYRKAFGNKDLWFGFVQIAGVAES